MHQQIVELNADDINKKLDMSFKDPIELTSMIVPDYSIIVTMIILWG